MSALLTALVLAVLACVLAHFFAPPPGVPARRFPSRQRPRSPVLPAPLWRGEWKGWVLP